MLKKNSSFFSGDKIWLFTPLLLVLLGLGIVVNASSASAVINFQDHYYFFNKQLISILVGFLGFIFFSFFDYKKIKKFSFLMLLANIFLLIIVLVPGIGREVYGGRRWLSLGIFGFQPAEFMKLTIVLYLSSLLEKNNKIIFFLLITGFILLLIMLEPDLSTSGIIALTAFFLYFLSGASLKNILALFFSGILILPALILTSPYRKKRFFDFLTSSFDREKSSYHIRQVLIALGSGGFWGKGFGQSRQKFLFLPEAATDSIFAIIAEEFGFLGASAIILIFIILIYRGFKISLNSGDFFGKMVSSGIVFFIGLQALLNLSSVVSLVPITGVPLPFISYGGSSLIVSLCAIGIVYNISRQNYTAGK